MVLPEGPFDIVLIDPPWDYDDKRDHKSAGMARSAYDVMSLSSIRELQPSSILSDNAAIFLWATGPKLSDAMYVIEAWNLKFLTVAFTWVKHYPKSPSDYSGLGHYTKSGTEFCLLARKGKPLPRLRRDIRQIVHAPVTRHSAKPPEVRERIVQLFGDRPRAELFARDVCPGWTAWGDGVDCL